MTGADDRRIEDPAEVGEPGAHPPPEELPDNNPATPPARKPPAPAPEGPEPGPQ